MTAVIEPVLILAVGIVVGMVALGLVSAVYGVLGGIGGLVRSGVLTALRRVPAGGTNGGRKTNEEAINSWRRR
jgi:hypothetical protein